VISISNVRRKFHSELHAVIERLEEKYMCATEIYVEMFTHSLILRGEIANLCLIVRLMIKKGSKVK